MTNVIKGLKTCCTCLGCTEKAEFPFVLKNMVVFELELEEISRMSYLGLLFHNLTWTMYFQNTENTREKVTIGAAAVGGCERSESPGHAQVGEIGLKDLVSTTDVKPQHTCFPLSVLCWKASPSIFVQIPWTTQSVADLGHEDIIGRCNLRAARVKELKK